MNDNSKIVAEVYNKYGKYYHESRKSTSGRLYNEYIDIPATLSLLPNDLKGLKILDAGCGSGIYSQILAKKGAGIAGIDISEKMIEIAKKETPPFLPIKYYVGSLSSLPFQGDLFDYIICTYVLENIEDIDRVFLEFNRVLKQKGKCVFSVSHPLRAQSEKSNSDVGETWTIKDYYKSGMRNSDFGGGMIVPKYMRTVEVYAKSIKRGGFVINDLLEPQPIKEGKKVDEITYLKAMRLPQLMTMMISKI